MTDKSLRGKVAIVGIGESEYYKYGRSPDSEFKLALKAILAACSDAGLDPHDIDGFASFSDERSDPSRLAAALGIRQLRSTTMQWGGGGGGCCAAVANGAAAIAAGLAECVVVFRSLAQGQFGRFGKPTVTPTISGDAAFQIPYGVISPAHKFALKIRRYMHEHGVLPEALRAIALASNYHAQNNPRAVMYGKKLDVKTYDDSRWIVEPLCLYDCCMENDGAAAIILVSAERAKDFENKAAYILGAAAGSGYRTAAAAQNAPAYASASYPTVSTDLYRMASVEPADIGTVQCYENFTGGVIMALAEHGLFQAEEANEFLTLENLIAPTGKLPLNTSGGNLAEGYIHGFELVVEAVRQIRGSSVNQAPRNDLALVIGGPMVSPVSDMILGSEATL